MLQEYKLTHSQLNSFLIEYEARKLGLNCHRLNHYLLIVSDKMGKEALFRRAAGPDVSYSSDIVAMNKDMAKRIWYKKQIPINPWVTVSTNESDFKIAEEFARAFDWGVVVKPIAGAGGRNVYTDISCKKELINAIHSAAQARVTNTKYLGPKIVMIERKFNAPDYRFFIVNGIVEGVLERVRPYIIGDGRKSISLLIQEKAIARMHNPDLLSRPLIIDEEVYARISNEGYKMDDVLPHMRNIILRGNANISTGGESVDITDKISVKIKSFIQNGILAIPNLRTCAVDVLSKNIMNDNDLSNSNIVFNEIESDAAMCMHHFPMRGKPRNIAQKILTSFFEIKMEVVSDYLHDFETNGELVEEVINSIKNTYYDFNSYEL
ncbi:hypothetical protein [Pleomorphovibrio marinus]|uniref:hypothetical protein n=1 Tax=Pleomorphovibrio marinus TaxID=2164132 RepID=UPI000E0C8EED|nr:hypothetical protein [Pleomorphovibrio marinus]